MKRPSLNATYEKLLGTAFVDHEIGRALLRDPQSTALRFGLSANEAAVVADIRAHDLRGFASALLPRLYGHGAAGMPAQVAVG